MTNDGSVCLCHFVAEGSFKELPGGGWLHRLRELDPNRNYREVARVQQPKPITRNWDSIMSTLKCNTQNSDMIRFASMLGVTVASLGLLDAAYMGDGKWAFPMFNSQRAVVGIRTRTEDGQKRSIKGTQQGLFIPSRRMDGLLVFAEGPTDAAAILDLGFDCIGRPSCHGCEEWSAELCGGRNVAILADNDASEVGRKGALKLAAVIKKKARYVKIVRPPQQIKDAREWVRKGASRESLQAMWSCAHVC